MKKLITALTLTAALTCTVPASAAIENDVYVISPRDNIKITVMDHGDLSGTYVPLSDYTFEYPLIGTVRAPGKTVLQLTEELKQRLSEYIIDPKITINITAMGGTKVYVFGQAPKQGAFYLNERTHNVVDALAAAGGFGTKTSKKRIILIRGGQKETMRQIDMKAYLQKGDLSQNVALQEGDVLYLTSNHKLPLENVFMLVTRAIAAWDDLDEVRKR